MFCHLHTHNEYSTLDGLGKAEDWAKEVERLKQKYLGLTNHGNIDGLIDFQEQCDKIGIKPVSGCELYVVDDANVQAKGEKKYHLTALIKNEEGYINLCKLLTYANLTGFYYKPRVDFKTLIKHLDGLVILTGCIGSFLNDLEDPRKGVYLRRYLEKIIKHIGDDFYLEVMPHMMFEQKDLNKSIIKLRKKYNLKLIATNDCHYPKKEHEEAQEILLAIQTRAKFSDKDRFKFVLKGLYLKSEELMKKAFIKQKALSLKEIREALENTIEVAKKCCDFRVKSREVKLPDISIKNEAEKLKKICFENFKEIFKKSIDQKSIYNKRFNTEFKVIKSKGFERYFLIVYDLLRYCREVGIMYGPARGSVAGSLIAYLLKITCVDPLQHKLLFSRFISRDRVDYPDIDLDFQDDRVEEVRTYLEEKFGLERVVGVSTVVKMKGKQTLRDLGRVFEIPTKEVEEITSLIRYNYIEENETPLESVLTYKEAKIFEKKYPHIIENALILENQIRAVGQHPAAVLLSPDDLTKGYYGNLAKRSNNIVLNWDMDTIEKVGLLKLDILALNTLTVLNETRRLVEDNSKGKDTIIFENIYLEDENLFDMINEGNTSGIFQLQTGLMKSICENLYIERFDHISDIIAMGRPGPKDSGMLEEYIDRKHGKRWKKKHQIYEDITRDTYGVVVYQEQIMAIINKMAGLSLSTADKIRKVISKKRDVSEFEPFKKEFIKGCLRQGTFTGREAEEFWAALRKHAGYSFNKSHSISYAMLGIWTAYCKYYYPTEFIAASLSYMPSTEKAKFIKAELLEEAFELGLDLALPKIGISEAKRWVVKDNKLYIPFIEIKGFGEKTAIKIASKKNKKTRERKQRSFFEGDEVGILEDDTLSISKHPKTKVERILDDIGAYSKELQIVKDEAQEYFDFNIFGKFEKRYKNLCEILGGDITTLDQKDALEGKIAIRGLVNKYKYSDYSVVNCIGCDLRNECRQPVPFTKGIYNAAIIAEAPGPREDEYQDKKSGYGKPLIGKAGQLLWKELSRYDLGRVLFHITNINKCYPSKSKTPNKKQIAACSPWLDDELFKIDCKLALVIGNNSLFYFTGNNTGITDLSGTTMWIESKNMWICLCVHPAAVLHNRRKNIEAFEKGIENFAETFKRFRWRKRINN